MKFGDLQQMLRKIELNYQQPLAKQHEIPVVIKNGDEHLQCASVSLKIPHAGYPEGLITINVKRDTNDGLPE